MPTTSGVVRGTASLCLLAVLVCGGAAVAEDAFYHLPVSKLKLTDPDAKLPEVPQRGRWWWRHQEYRRTMLPHVVLEGKGEAYVNVHDVNVQRPYEKMMVGIRAVKGRDVRGWLVLPKKDFSGMVRIPFTVPAAAADGLLRTRRDGFYAYRQSYYRRMLSRGAPGAAWFRLQLTQTRLARGEKAPVLNSAAGNRNRDLPTEQFDLFTGGRAISENLALDRQLQLDAKHSDATVPIETLKGITIREIEWKRTWLKEPKLDPLAKRIPHDQHALFFPTFDGLLALIDEADAYGTPVLQTIETRTEDAGTGEKYRRQLCLESTGLSRYFGAQAVASVAFTGSDPYLRTGADVALLFEAKNMKLLRSYMLTKQAAAKSASDDVQAVGGEMAGVSYVGVRSPDRRICSYLATIDDVLIVTNSPYQLARLIATSKGKETSLGSLMEYKFFRNRYKLGDEEESGFLVLTDATIRRWCSARWRIGNARRTRAAAVLADLQARHQDALVRGTVKSGEFKPPYDVDGLGDVRLTEHGVTSSAYGTLEFQTPIAELSLDKATWVEAAAYRRWRQGYENQWRQFFDPIAVRLAVDKKRLSADLTVMPLVGGSDYRWLIELTRGGKLLADSGDPHRDALVNMAFALNKKNGLIWGWPKTPVTSVSIYLEDDPFWEKLAKAEDQDGYLEKHGRGAPLAVYVDSPKPVEFGKELLAVLPLLPIEQRETKEHNGHKYVKFTPKPQDFNDFDLFAEIYVATLPRGVLMSFNEKLTQRALDRGHKREKDAKEGKEPAVTLRPWLGEHAGLHISRGAVDVFGPVFGREYQRLMRVRSWSSLAILNELKRRYPKHDPLEVYQQVWGARLYCPGGGRYVWNAKWQTMESTVYGHPGEPKRGPNLPIGLANLDWADFGVTFENNGLRAKTVLQRRLGD